MGSDFKLGISFDPSETLKGLDTVEKGFSSAFDEIETEGTKSFESVVDAIGDLIDALKDVANLDIGESLDFGGDVSDSSRDVSNATRSMTGSFLSLTANLDGMLESFSKLGSLTGGIFDSFIDASPAASSAMAQIQLQTKFMSREFGDALAPILKIIAEALSDLTVIIQDLPDGVKTAVAAVVGLLFIGSELSGIIIAIGAIGGTTILILAAIALAVGLLFIAWQENWFGIQETTEEVMATIGPQITQFINEIVEDFKNLGKELSPSIMDTIENIKELAIAVSEFYEVIKPFTDILIDQMFVRLEFGFKTMLTTFNLVISNMKDGLKLITALLKGDWAAAWESAKDILGNFQEFAKSTLGNIGDFFTGMFDTLGIDIKAVLSKIVSFINEDIIDQINSVIRGLNVVPGVDIPEIPRIPEFETGGFIPKDTLGFLHEGEVVLNANQVSNLGGASNALSLGTGSLVGGMVNRQSGNVSTTNQQFFMNNTFRDNDSIDRFTGGLRKNDFGALGRDSFTT